MKIEVTDEHDTEVLGTVIVEVRASIDATTFSLGSAFDRVSGHFGDTSLEHRRAVLRELRRPATPENPVVVQGTDVVQYVTGSAIYVETFINPWNVLRKGLERASYEGLEVVAFRASGIDDIRRAEDYAASLAEVLSAQAKRSDNRVERVVICIPGNGTRAWWMSRELKYLMKSDAVE